jgi:hypothetical protein
VCRTRATAGVWRLCVLASEEPRSLHRRTQCSLLLGAGLGHPIGELCCTLQKEEEQPAVSTPCLNTFTRSGHQYPPWGQPYTGRFPQAEGT